VARVDDYIGHSFGDFRIEAVVAHGVEAEVFACSHLPTRTVYILRLPAQDAALWRSDPVVPPRNALIEVPNAKGTWAAAQAYYFASLHIRQEDEHAWQVRVPPIYGILDNRYLVPVASPIWRTGAMRIDQLLYKMPAAAVDGYGPLEALLLLMATSASIASRSGQASEQWHQQWSYLLGGRIATGAAERYLRSGTQPDAEKERAIRMVASATHNNPELAENIVLRLCSCIARSFLSVEDAWATLHCKHFRRNVTFHELHQIISAHELLSAEAFPDKDTLAALRFALVALTEKPDDEFENPAVFETLASQPEFEIFSLFVQEFAGREQSVPTLTRAAD
jgi:hypothetical protein